MLIKLTSRTDVSVFDVIQNLFPDKTKDFVININETDIALVKEVKSNITSADLEKLAGSIVDTLSSEFYTHCIVGIGTVVSGIRDLARSFKEAQVALAVSKVFDLFESEAVLANVNEVGEYLSEKLKELKAEHDTIIEHRGFGLMQGLEFSVPQNSVFQHQTLQLSVRQPGFQPQA